MSSIPAAHVEPAAQRIETRGRLLTRYLGRCLGVCVLVAAVLAVYGPGIDGPLVFDDAATVAGNPSIRQLWPLWGSTKGQSPLNPPDLNPIHGRPLVNLSLAVNYHFGQLNARGYRIVEIAAHLISAMLLWSIVAMTLRLEYFQGRFEGTAGWLAFAAALLWALHPLATESVVYITQRTELLMGMFYLATVYGSLRYWLAARPSARGVWLVVASVCCLLGILCKETMASAPAMVLLYERTFLAQTFRRALRRSWPLYLGLSLCWIPAILLNFHGPKTPQSGFGLGVPAEVWWLTQTKVLFLYLKLAISPWPLVIHYDIPLLTKLGEAWPWLLAAAVLIAAAAVLAWRRFAIGYVAVWVLAVLSPTLLIPLVGETAAERRMYVPLAALVPLAVVGFYAGCQRISRWRGVRLRRPAHFSGAAILTGVAVLGVAVVFGVVARERVLMYGDELWLWQDAARHQPLDPLVQVNLGIQLGKTGRTAESLDHLQQAVKLDPKSYRGHYNLARTLESIGRPSEAIGHYQTTLELHPDDAAAHTNLGRLLVNAGQPEQAFDHYAAAIAIDPNLPEAYTNLGLLLVSQGFTQKAVRHFEAAHRLRPDLSASTNLAAAYCEAGEFAKAVAIAREALVLAKAERQTALAQQLEEVIATYGDQPSAR